MDQSWSAVAVRLCKLQCESTGEKIYRRRCLPGPLTEIGQQSRSIASASGRSVLTRPLPLSLPPPPAIHAAPLGSLALYNGRPTGSAEHACASSAQLFPGPAPSSAFLGRRRPRVPDRQAISIACSRRRSRTYVLLAGRISFRWTVDRFSLVGASGRPAFLDHHTIARGRAELATFVCMQTQEQRGGETSRQAHPADKPSCFLLLRPPLHSSMMSNQRCMQGPQFLFLRLYMFTYQYWFFLVAIYNHAYA